jgi:ABC-type phosphate transport system substrate-binding protein
VTGRSLRALAALFLVSTMLIATASEARANGPAILGGGSGFAALEIDQWRADTARAPFNLTINYVAQGSTFGRSQFGSGAFDFGASDIQYMESELGPGGIIQANGQRCAGKQLAQCFVYVPVSAGGLAFMYNLTDNSGNRVSNLRLTRDAACKIFTGAITKWNDPAIVATNPQLASFDRDIRPVVRSDGAGESFVLSEFCIAVDPGAWNGFIASQRANSVAWGSDSAEFTQGQPTSVWPQQGWGNNPVSVAFADGVAGYVADPVGGPNTITYVAAGYAKVRSFPTASLQNAAGVYTQPDESNVTVALGYAHERGNGTFALAFDGPDPRAYFPSTYSYVLAQTAGFDPNKGAVLGEFLCYATSQGQVIAPDLRYARLSSALVQIATDAIEQIPGAPPRSQCFIGTALPPPPPNVCQSNCGGPGPGGPGANGPGSTQGGRNGPGGSNSRARGANGAGGANCAPKSTPRAAKPATTQKGKTAKASTTTTTTTVPCTAVGGSRGNGAYGRTATTGLSGDAELARSSAAPSGHSGGSIAIWLLLAGAVCALGVTTYASRRRTVG